MCEVILGIGGNTGDRLKNLLMTGGLLADRAGCIVAFSPIVESEAWGFQSENWFLNQILIIETSLRPDELLEVCQDIEAKLGRTRAADYSDRRMDIDILFYDNMVLSEGELIIPHPRLHQRLFILKPLAFLRPDYIHPGFGMSIKEMLDSCTDTTKTNWYRSDQSSVLLP